MVVDVQRLFNCVSYLKKSNLLKKVLFYNCLDIMIILPGIGETTSYLTSSGVFPVLWTSVPMNLLTVGGK